MIVAGLTGGIGSGKSTFAKLLAERGAEIIDADELGRGALRPGQPAWHDAIGTFGDDILVAGTSEIDRARLASIVFSDPAKLAALNAMVHPIIVSRIAAQLPLARLLEKADIVVQNNGSLEELRRQADQTYAELTKHRDDRPGTERNP
jgi:dephospho-CoA kinase